ncbi:MAG: nuclear transport factor 2 family protein [Acidobacteriia bacterium]|nr:nuclear transport factor 2 family protein [Terriglobia bacterium]
MRQSLCGILAVAFLAVACRKGEVASRDAIREAIQAHLQQQQNLVVSNVDLELRDVKFSGETATAQVQFRSRQSPNLVVGVNYQLRRVAGRWKVESSSLMNGMGMGPHGGSGGPATAPTATSAETPLQPSH